MARRGGLGAAYSKWDKFEEDDPLARLRVTVAGYVGAELTNICFSLLAAQVVW